MATAENRFSFTREKLATIVCPPSGRPAKDGRVWAFDTTVARLAYCAVESGAAAFYFYGKVDDKPVKKRIGTLEELNVQQARTRVAKWNSEIAQGRNPFAEAKAAKAKALSEANLTTLWESYRTHWLASKRPASVAEFVRLYDAHLAKWAKRPIRDITSADVEKLKTDVGVKHPATANRLLTIISAMYRRRGHAFGLPRGYTPSTGVDAYPEKARDRVLTSEELGAVLAAIDADENETAADYFRMLIFTGQRRETVAGMNWQDISMQSGTWRIPGATTKNGSALTLALIPDAMNILRRRHDSNPTDSPYVFPGRHFTAAQGEQVKALRSEGKSTRHVAAAMGLSQTAIMHMLSPKFIPREASAFNGAGRAWTRIIERAGIRHATIHDVRRTFCTNMIEAGIPLPIVSAAMGHKSTQTTAKHYSFASDKAVAKATRETMAAILEQAKATQKTAAKTA